MRHMRSRRILAMLLALSMIFGLLTTTALADNGVDQNPSNVEESAANGTSEGGSGEGQSSGASEDESSKVTNKEDVPTEEETNPEEKKTTSSEEVDTQVGEGMEVPTATTIATDEALINAINNAVDGDTITLAEGQYQISDLIGLSNANKAVTISAETNATVILNAADGIALHGAKITFNGITFQWGTANYKGIQHASELEYNDCIINGKVFLYAGKETFNHCTFNQDSADYCVWTYGAAETTFNDCTFNCKGKAVLVYNEGYIKTVKVEVNNTTFAASETVDKKAAIELDTHLMKGASITVDNASTATGFSTNTTDGAGLWNAKRIDSENNETVEVVVGGEVKYTLTTAPVAMVNGVSYDKLEDAFAALSDKAYTLTLNDESAWDTATPVYWAAGTQSGYEATLAEALTAAYKANVGDITIICRPGADVGTMTHGHVADNLTIYGNDAYISGGECELEVDTFKFDRSTGKQATDGVTLDKDITITAYELDNLGVWGQRNTGYTVNVNLTDCDTVQGITVQRVYISGTTGMNNITLTGCDFGTTATSVYSNADGDINITNCSFTGAQVPVNFNHKTDGEQTLRVSNCEFNACGDAGEWKQFAAPVRFVNSGSGKQSATVDTCTFTDTVGANGDILIGDGRTGQESNDVNLTVTNTAATVMAQKPGYYTNDGTTDNALKGEKALTAGETLTNASINSLISGTTATKGTEANPYTLEELGEMTRDAYIAAQKELGGTMYVTVGNYSYDKDGVLGNGVRNDKPGQTEDRNVLNGYNSNGYLGEKNDGANGLNIVFVGSSITSGVKGYKDIDNIGTSLLLAVPAYTNVTFKGITFNNVMCFNYQLYTSPWSQLGELKFDGCTFNGIIVGAIAAQTLTFNGCEFTNYTNSVSENNSNPTWIRPAYGNWNAADNDGQGPNFQSLTTINFTNNTVTSTRPVKFARISQWDKTATITVSNNEFNMTDDGSHKNVGMYLGAYSDETEFNLKLGTNSKSDTTAAIFALPDGKTSLPVGSTVTDLNDKPTSTDDAVTWHTETKITLKTEPVPAVKNVAMVGDTEYATLEDAIAKAEAGQTVTLIADVNTPETTYVVSKNLTIDLNGKTVTGSGYDGVFQIDGADAKVLIKNGNVVAVEQSGSAGKYAMAVWACAENCELTLEGLTVTQDIAHTDDKQMDMIYTSKGTIIINSGSFTSGTPAWTLNCKDAAFKDGSAKIIVNGGTFTGFDPCNNAAEGKGTSFVAEGVGVDYDENGSFTAKTGMVAQVLEATGSSVKAFATLDEAFNAAIEGQTVRLLKDLTEDVTIDKNITLDLGGKTLTNTNAGHATITIAKDATATVKNGSVVGGTSYYNIQNNGTATFEGLTATAGNNGSSMIDNWGTLTIKSGTYTGGVDTVKNEPNAKLTVDGGTFTLTKGTSKGFTGVIFNYGELTINDGTFIQSDTNAPYGQAQVIHTDKSGSNLPSTVIKGGVFKNLCTRDTAFTVRATNAAAGATKVSGGTFNKSISEGYCANGFIPTKNADGTYGVKKGKYVATVGDTGYETLAAAVKTKINGKTVMLLDDVTENIEIAKAKNFTLDLNGHTINGGTVKDKATIMNNGTVTITDSSAAKNGTIKRDDNGTVGETSYYVIHNIGTMTIEQANVTNNSGYKKTNPSGSMVGSSLICNGDDDLGGTLNISGGKFEQKNFIAIKNGALGKLNVTGGTISSDHSAIQNWFEATITGGEINGQLWTDAYKEGESVGHTTIGGSAKFTGEIVMDIYGSVKPELEISGGTLDVTNWRITTAAANAGAKPAVSGGTFSSAIPYEYCAAGYIPADKGDGTYGVKEGTYVAEVNGKQYETLQAAIDAASKNQTVKLLNNTKENVTIAKALTLDLNGKTLNGGQEKGKPALTVTARVVTVRDSSEAQTGTIMREDTAENSGVSSHYVIDVQDNGWLKFESGKVTNESGIVGVKGASLVRVGDDSVAKYPGLVINGGSFRQDNFIAIKVDRGYLTLNDGTITSANSYAIENWFSATIKGGTVNGTVASWTYSGGSNSTTTITGGTINGNVNSVNYGNAEGKTAKVTISGGTVNGELDTRSYDPTTNDLTSIDDAAKATIGVTGGTFSTDPTKYVVEGSSVTTNSDGTYGVEKAYLAKVGDTSYYTMDEAFHAAVASGETLYLLRDYTTNAVQNSGSNSFTIDLSGHTWKYTGSDVNSAAFEINYPNVTLTVKNGTVVSNSMIGLIPSAMGGKITYDNSGLVFESVEATANGNSGIETNGNNTNDTVTLKNSTLNVPNGFGIYFPSSGTLTIDNSQITAKTLGVQVCSGSLDIKGAETKIEVTGDPVPKTENDGAIQDGAAISIVNRADYKGLDKITVTEGTFKAKSGNAAVKAYNWANQAESDFTESNKVAISGGTFSSAVAPEYCAEGFEPKDNGDGTYGVQPDGNVAEIGSVKYASLDEALKAAKDRETVKLLKDAELEEVVIRSGRTLDLNGHTLKADYVTYFGGNLVDNSAAHTGLLKVLSADEILFTKNKKIDAMTQIPIYSLEKQGYVFEEIVLRVAPVTNKTPGALQAVYRPRQKDGKTDLSDAQKAMFGSANGHPVTATFRLVYKYKNSNEVQTFEFDFVDTYMDIYLNQNLYMYVTVTGLDIANIETITVTPVLKSAGGQVELVGKTIDTAAVLANLIGQ